jgi:hypothetical protein
MVKQWLNAKGRMKCITANYPQTKKRIQPPPIMVETGISTIAFGIEQTANKGWRAVLHVCHLPRINVCVVSNLCIWMLRLYVFFIKKCVHTLICRYRNHVF